MGDIGKLLLKVIGLLMANTGVASAVVVVVKIVGDAGLGIGQVGEHGSVAVFYFLDFGAGLPAFGLGVVVVLAAPAAKQLGPCPA